jgi:Ca2+-binding EF-hand superfamily protein
MKWYLLLTSLALAGFTTLAAADDVSQRGTVKPPPRRAPGDVQDIVYLRGSRPVLVRFHVRVDGKAYAAEWNAFIDQLFAYLDVNGDGVLDQAEAARAPRAQSLLPNQQGRGFFQIAAANFNELQPEDGKVTKAKLAAYYRRSGLTPFQLQLDAGAAAQGEALTEILFKALDRNNDGKLSKEELQRAADSLRRFDIDDDETVTIQELVPNNQFPFRFQGPQSVRQATGFFTVNPDDPTALVAELLTAFDKNKDNKLSREEIGLEQDAFDKLDTNRDGQLDTDELAQLPKLMKPDGEFIIRIGKRGPMEEPFESVAAASPAKRSGDGAVLSIGAVQLNIKPGAAAGRPVPGGFNNRQFFAQQFKGAAGQKGYLEKKDIQGNARFLGPIFPLADRDGDGKLTEKELNTFLDIVDKAGTSFVALTVADQGRGLFDALDANRDGRLAFHELRSAWDRLAVFDHGNRGYITRADIPGQLDLTLSRGQPNQFGRPMVRPVGPVATNPREPAKGPLWFRKMDRNGDGVVSQREWLGSIEDFKRFDLNGDGVIDLDEAEKADAIMRAAAEQRK